MLFRTLWDPTTGSLSSAEFRGHRPAKQHRQVGRKRLVKHALARKCASGDCSGGQDVLGISATTVDRLAAEEAIETRRTDRYPHTQGTSGAAEEERAQPRRWRNASSVRRGASRPAKETQAQPSKFSQGGASSTQQMRTSSAEEGSELS